MDEQTQFKRGDRVEKIGEDSHYHGRIAAAFRKFNEDGSDSDEWRFCTQVAVNKLLMVGPASRLRMVEPAMVVESPPAGSELPTGPGLWCREGEWWMVSDGWARRLLMDRGLNVAILSSTVSLPRGGWFKVQPGERLSELDLLPLDVRRSARATGW